MAKKQKRKYTRFKGHYLIKYKVIDKKKVLSFSRNIGAGGLLFHSRERIPLKANIELIINYLPYPTPIKIIAEVVRIKSLPKIEGFDIAVQFINIKEKDREFINKRILSMPKRR